MKYYFEYETPIGTLYIAENGTAITDIGMAERQADFCKTIGEKKETPLLKSMYNELMEYFSGKRKVFDIPIEPEGTEFQKKVWRALCEIPYGQTRSYGDIAKKIGNTKASRAVGGANNRNPIMIVVPCHRVIGTNKALVGYAGGLGVKQFLLELECSKTDGIIFDVDGTLWDSTEIIAGVWNQAIAESGVHDVTVTAQDLKKLFGKTMKVIADELLPAEDEAKRSEVMDLCCVYEHEALTASDEDITYPNVAETIQALAKRYKLFIVSNCQKGYIELFLDKTGLHAYITDIECYGNTEKPKGENIRLVVERNHLQNAVYVGDTAGDYEAAEYAGIPMIFAAYGFGSLPEGSHVMAEIHTFQELETCL